MPTVNPAFRVNAPHVRVDRVLRYEELRRDALARAPAQRQREDLRFPLRQRGVRRDALASLLEQIGLLDDVGQALKIAIGEQEQISHDDRDAGKRDEGSRRNIPGTAPTTLPATTPTISPKNSAVNPGRTPAPNRTSKYDP